MRYRITLISLFVISMLIFFFQGKDFMFTMFKGGKEYNEGTKLLEKKDFAGSIEFFDMAIEKNPLFSEAYLNLGYAHAHLEQYDQAETDIWTAIELLKNSHHIETEDKTHLHQKISHAYKNLAILVYQQKIKESIRNGKPGEVLKNHEHYLQCIHQALESDPKQTDLNKYLDLHEKNKSLDIANAYYQSAMIQLESENLRIAEQNLKDALQQYPNHQDSHLSLGIIYQSFNETDKSIDHFEKSLQNTNDEIHILNTLSELYASKTEFDKAIEYYQRSIKMDPNQSGVIYNIAAFFKELGNTQESISYFQMYLDMEPNAPDKNNVDQIIKLLHEKN